MKKIKYLVVPFLIIILMITGCAKKQENKQNNSTTTSTTTIKKETSMQIEINDNLFYVNGNKVDFYDEMKEIEEFLKDVTEEEFYNEILNKYTIEINKDGEKINISAPYNRYEIYSDIVYVQMVIEDLWYGFFINKDGQILNSLNDITSNSLVRKDGGITTLEKIEDNKFYFESLVANNKFFEAEYCNKKINGNTNDVAKIIDEVIYLGNDKFEINKEYKSLTFEEMVQDDKIEC